MRKNWMENHTSLKQSKTWMWILRNWVKSNKQPKLNFTFHFSGPDCIGFNENEGELQWTLFRKEFTLRTESYPHNIERSIFVFWKDFFFFFFLVVLKGFERCQHVRILCFDLHLFASKELSFKCPPPFLKKCYCLERREQENIGIQGKELRAEEVREQGNKEKNRTMG